MTFEEKIAQYAKLAVQVGVNVQKGQEVLVQCPVECAFFARAVAEASFEAGAKDVIVHYADDLRNAPPGTRIYGDAHRYSPMESGFP